MTVCTLSIFVRVCNYSIWIICINFINSFILGTSFESGMVDWKIYAPIVVEDKMFIRPLQALGKTAVSSLHLSHCCTAWSRSPASKHCWFHSPTKLSGWTSFTIHTRPTAETSKPKLVPGARSKRMVKKWGLGFLASLAAVWDRSNVFNSLVNSLLKGSTCSEVWSWGKVVSSSSSVFVQHQNIGKMLQNRKVISKLDNVGWLDAKFTGQLWYFVHTSSFRGPEICPKRSKRHAWADGLPAMKTWAACGCLTGSLWKPSESKWVEWNKPWRSYSPTGPQKHCLAGSFHPLIQKLRPPAGKYKSHHKSSSMSMLSWSPYKRYQHQPRPTILPNPSNAGMTGNSKSENRRVRLSYLRIGELSWWRMHSKKKTKQKVKYFLQLQIEIIHRFMVCHKHHDTSSDCLWVVLRHSSGDDWLIDCHCLATAHHPGTRRSNSPGSRACWDVKVVEL